VDPNGTESVLHNFDGSDGNHPASSLVFDSAGNLYGTAPEGGTGNAGTIFKLDPSENLTVLYSFTGGADGNGPSGGVVFDSAGNLYGATTAGGTANAGVVYKLDPLGNLTVLYSFTGGADGSAPNGNVMLDPAGNIYGVTWAGGKRNNGVVFKITRSADRSGMRFSGDAAEGRRTTGAQSQSSNLPVARRRFTCPEL